MTDFFHLSSQCRYHLNSEYIYIIRVVTDDIALVFIEIKTDEERIVD